MEMTVFPAHIRIQDGDETWQTTQDHCRNTADGAQRALSPVGLGQAAYLTGLLHDMGKFTAAFRAYLDRAVHSKGAVRGSVNHTFAGVRYLLEHYHTPRGDAVWGPIAAELLAYAVGAHHGLFDCVDEHGRSGFRHRMDKPDTGYEEATRNFLEQCTDCQELDTLFDAAVRELTPVLEKLCGLARQDESYDGEVRFYFGLLARLLLSAVMEGDRSDTAAFMDNVQSVRQPENRRPMWDRCLAQVERKLGEFPLDTPIARARRDISDRCRSFGDQPGGVFRLNVPTGSGKTLSSLRYSLAHAASRNSSRIIFTSPLLSILDQNAKVLRDYIQDDSLILEHHSNVVRTDAEGGAIVKGTDPELMAENWGASIIITTLVQLLDTCFSGKTACIRRFQALVNSIIVIDEVQTVPSRMLSLFDLAVSFLAEVCGATVILCSATQPCLERAAHPIPVPIREMVPRDPALWEAFRRTVIVDAGARTLEEIPAFLLERLEETDSLLAVCNKKSEAQFLYRALAGRDIRCFHLSASMCPAHRREVLADMQASMLRPGKTLCVATQVVEAGVDLSFGCVVRLTAGLDNIIQAAGRCNRNGESPEPAPVYVLNCTGEQLGRLEDIQRAKTASVDLLECFRRQPEAFRNDLSSDEAVNCYYRQLYQEMPRGFQDYPVKDRPTLYSMLSDNISYVDDETGFTLNQAFRQAGTLFQVFDDETEDVVVPYGGGSDCIADLCSEQADRDPAFRRDCLKRAKLYTVSLFQGQKKQLEQRGALYSACDGSVLILRPGFYDDATGLSAEAQNNFLEVTQTCQTRSIPTLWNSR